MAAFEQITNPYRVRVYIHMPKEASFLDAMKAQTNNSSSNVSSYNLYNSCFIPQLVESTTLEENTSKSPLPLLSEFQSLDDESALNSNDMSDISQEQTLHDTSISDSNINLEEIDNELFEIFYNKK